MSILLDLPTTPATHSVRRRWLGTPIYWACQIVGWGGVLVAFIVPILLHEPRDAQEQIFLHLALVGRLVQIGVGLLGAHLLRVVILWILRQPRSLGGFILRVAPWLLAIPLLETTWLQISARVYAFAMPDLPSEAWLEWTLADFIDDFSFQFTLAVIWTSFYLAARFYRHQQQTRLDQARLLAFAREAELRALKAQINPHFLFNSLNSLRALMPPEDERSRATVSRLANLLRASLATDQEPLVPLSRELGMVEGYLEIEKLRHEERLRWKIVASAAARAWPVPPFALQGLVENAIKHGINRIEEGGEIEISAQVIEARLHLDVTNPGFLEAAPRSPGVGLANARARLLLLFGPAASLELIAPSPGRVQARVRLQMPLAPLLAAPLSSL